MVDTADRTWPPRRVAVVGVGLIGGSIARAARRAWPKITITGIDHVNNAAHAQRLGVCDDVCALADLGSTDLVVLAAPIDVNIAAIAMLAARSDRPLVTDAGSTKRTTIAAAETVGDAIAFIGGHPMAGGEQSGPDASRADLFDHRAWFIVSPRDAVATDVAYVERIVASLGAEPCRIDADVHDQAMALVSHLPQLTASVLMGVVGARADRQTLRWAGQGLVDTTRLASANAPWLSAVFQSNADRVVSALDALIDELSSVRRRLMAGEPLDDVWRQASECRAALLAARSSADR